MEDAALASLAVELAERQLELNQGRRLYYVVAALLVLMLAVTIYQGDWTWVVVCVVVLGFFVYWLVAGQARRNATLQRAIDANRALVSESKPARARRQR